MGGLCRIRRALLIALFLPFATLVRADFQPVLRFLDDPVDTSVYDPPVRLRTADEKAELGVVQLRAAPDDSALAELRASGLRVLGYVPDNGYIVWGTPGARRAAIISGIARWEGGYRDSWRMAAVTAQRAARAAGGATMALTIQFVNRAPGTTPWRERLAALGAETLSVESFDDWEIARVTVPSEAVRAVGRQPDVIWLEESGRFRLRDERASRVLVGPVCPTQPGYGQDLARFGVNGAGVVVQVMDSGLDQGDASGLPGTAHPDLLGRIAGVLNATFDARGDDVLGHGTLNAGILVAATATGRADAHGFALGLGVAPGARVFGTKIFNNRGDFVGSRYSFAELGRLAVAQQAVISNNSWGSRTDARPNDYDLDAVTFDRLTRDADLLRAGNQEMLYVFAAGNEGPGARTLNSPATGKNVVAVGAAENCDADGTDGCLIGPGSSNAVDDVVRSSSRGPTVDGRTGPTLVAVGTHIYGPASTAAGYTGSEVCDKYWPAGQTQYARSSGTSHAAPMVSGAAALYVEHMRRRSGKTPSPALIRAALVNACESMEGGDNGAGGKLGPRPDTVQGWGRLHSAGLFLAPDRSAVVDQTALLTPAAPRWSFVIQTGRPDEPLRVTLSWTDAPGQANVSPALVNDLDLRVTGEDGATYLGNVLSGGFSVPGGAPDRRHTLESVVIARPTGLYRVEAQAHRLAGDGVPGNATLLDQDFAIAVRNGTTQSSHGFVYLDQTHYSCAGIARVRLSDSDLRGRGFVPLNIRSALALDSEQVAMVENPAGSGMFQGNVTLSGGVTQPDGVLQVRHLDTITATYTDNDTGQGAGAVVSATATTDCLPPRIEQARTARLDETSTVIVWRSDEPATGRVLLGRECGHFTMINDSGGWSTVHEHAFAGLSADTAYFFVVQATDVVGNFSTDNNGGVCHAFRTGRRQRACVFADDGNQGMAQWTADPPWAIAAGAFVDSPTGNYGNNVNVALTSAPISLAGLIAPRLRLEHRYYFEPNMDFGYVEVSVGGGPWLTLAAYTGTFAPLGVSEVDLSPAAGAVSARIRFRVQTNESVVRDGWTIDSLEICEESVLFREGALRLDRAAYRCVDTARFWVSDLDLQGAGTLRVAARVRGRPEHHIVVAEEVSYYPGRFAGALSLSGGVETGVRVADGDVLELEYADADNGLGAAVVRRATAVIDCRPPVITDVRALGVTDSSAVIRWRSSETANGWTQVGLECGGGKVFGADAWVDEHNVIVSGLLPNTRYRYLVEVRDSAGNAARSDANGACHYFTTGLAAPVCPFSDDMESGSDRWIATPPWGLTAGVSFNDSVVWSDSPAGNYRDNADVSLSTVDFDLSRARGARLTFRHRHALETGLDFGHVEVSIDRGRSWSLPLLSATGFRNSWKTEDLSLDAYSGQRFVRVRFRLVSDESVTFDGWYIDDVAVCYRRLLSHQAELRVLQPVYRCDGVLDAELADLGAAGTADGMAFSLGTGDLEPFRFDPDDAFAGRWLGRIPTRTHLPGAVVETDGLLDVIHGDRVLISTTDRDDGMGGTATLFALAVFDCRPPVIRDVRIVEESDQAVTMAWETDKPAICTLELGTACAARTLLAHGESMETSHRLTLSGLSPFSQYFAAVRAVDSAGNVSIDDNSGRCYPVRTGHYSCLFSDDVELRTHLWQPEAPWARVTEKSHSPQTSWTDSPAPAFYSLNADTSLATVPLDFTHVVDAVLAFHHSYSFQEHFAFGRVEVSTDGATWSPPLRTYTGTQSGWTRESISLSAYNGRPRVQVRFRLLNLGDQTRDGWHIDDISICQFFSPGAVARLQLNAPRYRCGETITVTVSDAGAAGRGQLPVTLRSQLTQDHETAALWETGAGSGVFVGHMFTGTGTGAGEGVLRVGNHDTIWARYEGVHAGGAGAPASAAAVFICAPDPVMEAALTPAISAAALGGTVRLELRVGRVDDRLLPVNLEHIELELHHHPALLEVDAQAIVIHATPSYRTAAVSADAARGLVRLHLSELLAAAPRMIATIPMRFHGERGTRTVVGFTSADLRLGGARLPVSFRTAMIEAGTPPAARNVFVPDAHRAGGIVPLVFDVVDLESHPVSIQVVYRVRGSSDWLPAAKTPDARTSGLSSSPAGVRHVFFWNANADIPPTEGGTAVVLRIVPADPEPGEAGESNEALVNALVIGTDVRTARWGRYE